MLERIKNLDAWAWANNPANTGNLMELIQKTDELLGSGFNNEVLTTEVKELRAAYPERQLLSNARRFADDFGSLAAEVEREVKTIQHMHRLKSACT